MKDADARARLDELEATIGKLPGVVAELVSKRFKGQLQGHIEQVNATLDRMRDAATGLEGLADLVQRMGEATNENTELLSVLESELNTLRVDFNAIREAQAEQSTNVERVRDTLRGVATSLGQVL